MVSELEYGFAPERGFLEFQRDAKPLNTSESKLQLSVDRTWQSAGLLVEAGDKLLIEARGDFNIGDAPKPWRSTANGVTLEYYRGQPLGKLLLTIAQPIATEPEFTQTIETIAVGEQLELTVKKAGELHFRVNESNAGLADNSGETTITVRKR
jgi:hypothetical protein